jgi:hypothetical protein
MQKATSWTEPTFPEFRTRLAEVSSELEHEYLQEIITLENADTLYDFLQSFEVWFHPLHHAVRAVGLTLQIDESRVHRGSFLFVSACRVPVVPAHGFRASVPAA